jgi:hypothetical protein
MDMLVGLPGLGDGQWQNRYLQRKKSNSEKKEQELRLVS